MTEYLHRHIPLTAAMDLRVTKLAHGQVEITAPLAPNLNHRGTVFGGSIATLAIVAGWTALSQALRERGVSARLVIQRSECDFVAPAGAEFCAVCELPAAASARFFTALGKRGRARITLASTLRAGAATVARAQGTYVAIT